MIEMQVTMKATATKGTKMVMIRAAWGGKNQQKQMKQQFLRMKGSPLAFFSSSLCSWVLQRPPFQTLPVSHSQVPELDFLHEIKLMWLEKKTKLK